MSASSFFNIFHPTVESEEEIYKRAFLLVVGFYCSIHNLGPAKMCCHENFTWSIISIPANCVESNVKWKRCRIERRQRPVVVDSNGSKVPLRLLIECTANAADMLVVYGRFDLRIWVYHTWAYCLGVT